MDIINIFEILLTLLLIEKCFTQRPGLVEHCLFIELFRPGNKYLASGIWYAKFIMVIGLTKKGLWDSN